MLSAADRSAAFPMRPLEMEPFRDALLSVSYGFVERTTLPSLYRSFDFPNPN